MIPQAARRVRRSLAFRMGNHAERLLIGRLSEEMAAAGLGNANSIHTYTTKGELRTLYDLASRLPQGSSVVEIGCYLGASTCYLAAGLTHRNGHLTCIDTWQNETMPGGTRDTFLEFRENTAPLASMITCVRKRMADVEAADLPNTCSLAFIDGDHSFDAVSADVSRISHCVPEDGIVAFHDAVWFPGVSRAIGTLLTSGAWTLAGKVENLVWLKRARLVG